MRSLAQAVPWYGLMLGEPSFEPAARETYSNGVRKAVFRDPDGNEVGVGGAPEGG